MSSLSTDGIGVSITFKKFGLSKCKNIDNEKENIYVEDLNDDDLEILKTKKLVSLDPGSKGICLLDESKNNSDKYKRKMRNNNLNYNTIQRRKESMRKRNNYILNIEKENNYITQKKIHYQIMTVKQYIMKNLKILFEKNIKLII